MSRAAVTRGYLYVVCAAFLWSLSGIAGKALFASGMSPVQLVQSRVTIAPLILLAALALIDRSLLRIRRDQVLQFVILGGFVMAVLQLSYFLAIEHIQVAAAILIQYLAPVLVAMFSMVFWREPYTHVKAASLALSTAGCYLTAGGYSIELLSMNLAGVFWGLCSAFFFAGYTLYAERKMHRYPPWTVLFYSLLFAGVSLNVAFPPFSILDMDLSLKHWGSSFTWPCSARSSPSGCSPRG
jgi:drug/metabolite transporter (DMT)-like permease